LAKGVTPAAQQEGRTHATSRSGGRAGVGRQSQRIYDPRLIGFSGGGVVLRRLHAAMRSGGRTAAEVVALRPDGTVRRLLTASPESPARPSLLGVAVDGLRLAWTARACGVVTVEAARIADLPPGGRVLRAPRRCPRPRSR
jgi:hypothetical protein